MDNKKTYADIIATSQVMLNGIINHKEILKKRGIDDDFIESFEKRYYGIIKMNNEQERLKADLKQKTETIRKEMSMFSKQMSEAKKLIKLSFDKTQWQEFGFNDKK